MSNNRRTFCKTVLAAVGAVLVPSCSDHPSSRADVTRYLVQQIAHPETADNIGLHFLERTAANPETPEHLTEVILQTLGVDLRELSAITFDDVGKRLAKRVHQDFAEEEVVTVDGWLLSQTEARLCALVYLYRHPKS